MTTGQLIDAVEAECQQQGVCLDCVYFSPHTLTFKFIDNYPVESRSLSIAVARDTASDVHLVDLIDRVRLDFETHAGDLQP